MSYTVITLCVSTFLIQCISAQNCGCITSSNNGGILSVNSVGPIAPSGLSLGSELKLIGELGLSGALPFLSAVAFEGTYPTSGSASVAYGCGDTVAITQERGNPSGNNANINGEPYVRACACRRN
ncbi:chorion class B protein PC401-like [Leguminivora glycinivorella]|uniref:chorion class B protein PC401-like n=1 Tax=Leguminivora glycinivorella TaxID=1035111 RepID=UPI00200D42D9|nr:chorion class B protein PC401-like [Leguminivora glycinivorella]